jgi:hypothetical protein
VTAAGTGRAGDGGPTRIGLIALLFAVVLSVILGGIAVLVARHEGSGSGDQVSAVSTGGPTPLPSVALIGDSITEQSAEVLADRLAARWDLVIDGRSGFTLAEQLPAARALAEWEPTQVVINLGSNDVARVSRVDVQARLAEMVALFPTARCIHLVTVNDGIVWSGRSYAAGAAAVNEAVAAIAAGSSRVGVIDWSAAVAEAEAAGPPGAPVLADTVHPTPIGRQLLGELYEEALSACPG